MNFVFHGLIKNCYIQEKIKLSNKITVQPSGELAGLSELRLLNEFLEKYIGHEITNESMKHHQEAWHRTQPVALITYDSVHAHSPQEAETQVIKELQNSIHLLSMVTGNAGELFAFILVSNGQSWIKSLPPKTRRRLRLGFGNVGNQYYKMLQNQFDKLKRNPKLQLLFSLLYEAAQEPNSDFKFFKYFTLLDVASQHISNEEPRSRIKKLFRQMNVGISMDPIDSNWIHKGRDIVDISKVIRDQVAHTGYFDPSRSKCPKYCRDAVTYLDAILNQIASYSETAVSFLANTFFQ